ncbi:MAG: hypothetical protein EZS28_047606 [Streblomastix strix]|uniref:Uncharacterized protein n=1 Tax=Streblomastix strix TaxID=222440 RepID=A0A5J4TFD6_9EUKA|nr:MAG: hypothetical protein EZS28_047606 [Streblomastix strix]
MLSLLAVIVLSTATFAKSKKIVTVEGLRFDLTGLTKDQAEKEPYYKIAVENTSEILFFNFDGHLNLSAITECGAIDDKDLNAVTYNTQSKYCFQASDFGHDDFNLMEKKAGIHYNCVSEYMLIIIIIISIICNAI